MPLPVEPYQEVISNNQEIFQQIQSYIQEAKKEIIVATSWFTDEVLFSGLVLQARAGVKVELIIAENADNQKLDFQVLLDAGASVVRIKNVGYGIMHQKFCVIDRSIALHGTYNWTNNAKNNNHESIIITNHKGTVESLIATFFDIKKRAVDILEGREPEAIDAPRPTYTHEPDNSKDRRTEKEEGEEFAKVLEMMIVAETSSFDRQSLKKEGYYRAKATNGDAQVLSTALDSVYSIFVNDINVAEEKKKRLATKVDELKLTTLTSLKDRANLQAVTHEGEIAANEASLKLNISKLQTSIDLDLKEIDNVKQTKLANNTSKMQP